MRKNGNHMNCSPNALRIPQSPDRNRSAENETEEASENTTRRPGQVNETKERDVSDSVAARETEAVSQGGGTNRA